MSDIGNQPSNTAFLVDTFSGNGSTTSFTMSIAPATPNSVFVIVSGVVQSPLTYSVVGTSLNFTQAPPVGTNNIVCRYLALPASNVTTTAYRIYTELTATAGQTTFSPASYTPGFIDVYRNGIKLNNSSYTATNGTTIVLNNATNLNDSIVVIGFYVSSVLNAIPNNGGIISSSLLDVGSKTGVGAMQLPSGTTAQRPSAPTGGMLRFNTDSTVTTAELYNGSTWLPLNNLPGSVNNPATSISQLALFNSASGTYYFKYSGTQFTAYVQFNGPSGKAWMHVGTINDSNEGNTNSSAHIWSASFNATQAASPWDDSTTFGTISFTADYKSPAWALAPFVRWGLKDNGGAFRDLFYTNTISSNNSSFSAYWGSLSWGANGSDVANAAYSAGRVFGQSVTSYGVSDPTLLGTRSIVLLKYGERDGVQDTNKDRSMICGYNYAAGDGVDSPEGLGCFTLLSGTQYYRDIVPSANAADNPPSSITGAPLNYTLWITDY